MEGGWFDERPGEPFEEARSSEVSEDSDDSADGLGGPAGEAYGPGSDGGEHRPPPRVLTMPVTLRGARVAVSVRAVVAFVVVLVVAVVFFAVRVARAQQAAAPSPSRGGGAGRTHLGPGGIHLGRGRRRVTSSGAAVPDVALSSGASARGSPGRLVVIDVVGQVVHPGVVTVPDGSRVVDVLTAAGGPLPGADVQRLNLARLVADGEQVFVPRPGETPPVLVGVRVARLSGRRRRVGRGRHVGWRRDGRAGGSEHRHPGGPRHAAGCRSRSGAADPRLARPARPVLLGRRARGGQRHR